MKKPHTTEIGIRPSRSAITFIVFIICLLLAVARIMAQNVTIPDTNFKTALLNHDPVIDSNDDGEISYGEAEAFDGDMYVASLGIEDLTGIEAFINLNKLEVFSNSLTSVDLSNNTELTFLNISLNSLESLDISTLTKLEVLSAFSSGISSIDVSNNNALTALYVHNNSITSIDVTPIDNLILLYVNGNILTELDVSSQPNLAALYANSNNIDELDLRKNSKLHTLYVQGNGMSRLDLRNGNNSFIATAKFNATSNDFTCIAVSDIAYATTNWTNIDGDVSFSDTYCSLDDAVYIPDTNFKTALIGIGNLNTNDDDDISYAEAENYSFSINVNDKTISDLTGLEALKNIVGFSAKNNSISEIDLSQNTELGTLVLDNNQLATIDVSNNIKLTHLQVQTNQLSSIDVSSLTELRKLWVKDNQLTSLNTSANSKLNDIECGGNQITSLDLSNNTALTTIQTQENNLTSLDVSNNPLLFRITAFYNDITSIDLSNNTALTSLNLEYNQLTSIDVSMLPILSSIQIRGNGENLTNVNLKNGNNYNFTGAILLDQNPNLICIQVDDPSYSQANWTFVDDPSRFSTDCNVVTIPDANFEAYLLEEETINTNNDNFIQMSEATAVTGSLIVSSRGIADLSGIEAFTNLTELQCNNNELTELDLSANASLVTVYAYSNSISSVDLGSNTTLEELLIDNNSLTTIDVSNNTGLTRLRCGFNSLGSIDVSQNVNLDYLNVRSAGLTSLDISQNVNLTYLEMSTNNLTSLDLSSNVLLETIFISENQLTVLDLSGNTNLIEFEANDNALESLNVANGNNESILSFIINANPNLTCVTVDDIAYSTTNWTEVDDQTSFSLDCNPLGVDEFKYLNVYPNPASSLFRIEGIEGNFSYRLMTLEGKTIKAGMKESSIDIESFRNGLYLLNVELANGSTKIIKILKTN